MIHVSNFIEVYHIVQCFNYLICFHKNFYQLVALIVNFPGVIKEGRLNKNFFYEKNLGVRQKYFL